MHHPNRDLEEVCYQPSHIAAVEAALFAGVKKYFPLYSIPVSGAAQGPEFGDLADNFRVKPMQQSKKPAAPTTKTILQQRADNAIADFESDRTDYEELLDEESLEEYGDDPSSFHRTVLRNDCPIIRKTLHNTRQKELDRYRMDFRHTDPQDLHTVISNLALFGREYAEAYRRPKFLKINTLSDLDFDPLDTDDYTVYKVIGGGIKSNLLYKLYPHIFPYRSQDAIWAMWFLVGQDDLGCRQSSEFLMIDVDKSTTRQNYYYPYALFALYALKLSRKLAEAWEQAGATFPEEHRFVVLHDFLSFVANQHTTIINELKKQPDEHSQYADAY
jgi:hypothetical protein